MIKYHSATGDLIIKDPNNQEKEYRVNLYNLLPKDINEEQKEAIAKTTEKKICKRT
ncbi:hypothetical protein [Planktothricoides raciborskii]|uniref:Uncharacterized protein n=1 Tax=Planktothricoides raciborskii GIHE-MW2 TaxID=2792601 RepID=A0AAU8J9S3_9CYAN